MLFGSRLQTCSCTRSICVFCLRGTSAPLNFLHFPKHFINLQNSSWWLSHYGKHCKDWFLSLCWQPKEFQCRKTLNALGWLCVCVRSAASGRQESAAERCDDLQHASIMGSAGSKRASVPSVIHQYTRRPRRTDGEHLNLTVHPLLHVFKRMIITWI